jgi:hypothetical protein
MRCRSLRCRTAGRRGECRNFTGAARRPWPAASAAPAQAGNLRSDGPRDSFTQTCVKSLAQLRCQRREDTVDRRLQALAQQASGFVSKHRLQPAIDRVLTTLTAELRQAFDARLRETVARAVAAEVARLRERG